MCFSPPPLLSDVPAVFPLLRANTSTFFRVQTFAVRFERTPSLLRTAEGWKESGIEKKVHEAGMRVRATGMEGAGVEREEVR